MWIQALAAHRSLAPFPPLELPDLTVITGLNGSGKTHLLEGIMSGQVQISFDKPDFPTTLAPPMPNSRNFVTLNNGDPWPAVFSESVASRLTGATITQGGLDWGVSHDTSILGFPSMREHVLQAAAMKLTAILGIPITNVVEAGEDLWSLEPIEVTRRAQKAGSSVDPAFVEHAFKEAAGSLLAVLGLGPKLRYVADRLGVPPLRVTFKELQSLSPWAHVAPFEPPIVQVFARYRDLRFLNTLQQASEDRADADLALDDKAFVERYGSAPWTLVSEALAAMDLPYRVAPPSSRPPEEARFVLRRSDTDAVVDINGLSSGERVLLRLAIGLFDYDAISVTVMKPQLLLLDEMDASLHPEMVQRWLGNLQTGIVGRLGIKVILTTHSPTTVALAPEGSIFEMTYGSPGPRSVTKQQAINASTFGIPTLSIDYSGRRQVFVESDTDAATYEILFGALKKRLDLPLALNFSSTGVREGNLEQNTGCTVVRRMVEQLSSSGARTVFGVLDWDGGNASEGRIRVVAEGTHYALDNLLVDPLLIGALLLRENRPPPGLDMTFAQLGMLAPDDLQSVANAVVNAVLLPPDSDRSAARSYYLESDGIDLPKAWQIMQGHDLENLVVGHFPVLRKWHGKGRGKLTQAVAELVIRDFPPLCPEPLARLLKDLASGDD